MPFLPSAPLGRAGTLGRALEPPTTGPWYTDAPAPGIARREALFPPELTKNTRTGQSRVLLNGNFEFLGSPVGDAPHCNRVANAAVAKA